VPTMSHVGLRHPPLRTVAHLPTTIVAALRALPEDERYYLIKLLTALSPPCEMQTIGAALHTYTFFYVGDWRAAKQWELQGRLWLPAEPVDAYWGLREALRASHGSFGHMRHVNSVLALFVCIGREGKCCMPLFLPGPGRGMAAPRGLQRYCRHGG